MLLSGTRKCENCNKEYEWDYIVPNRLSEGKFDVVVIKPNVVHVNCINPRRENPVYHFSCRCPKCALIDAFDYDNPEANR